VTTDERTRMKDTLRAAVSRARLPQAELQHPGRFHPPVQLSGDLFDRFRRELSTLGGTVHEAADTRAVASIVSTLVEGQPEPKVLMWDTRWLPVPGISEALVSAGLAVVTQSPESARSPEHRRILASAAIGLTGADAGLAETGSIVVASGSGRGRLASLLPPIHVALLRRGDIVESLAVLIAKRPELVTSGANFVCITGPSRTADIEHTLSRGVHGPKEVHVIVI